MSPLPSAVTFSAWVVMDATTSPTDAEKCTTLLSSLNVVPTATFRVLPSTLGRMMPLDLCPLGFFKTTLGSVALSPPWPHLLISMGATGAAVAQAIKTRSADKTFTVALNTGTIPTNTFDMVLSTLDHPLKGANALETVGGLSTLTPQKLNKAAFHYQNKVTTLPHPLIGVFIAPEKGFFSQRIKGLYATFERFRTLARETRAGLLLFCPPSFYARYQQTLNTMLGNTPHIFWPADLHQDHLLFQGFLGLTDYILAPDTAGSCLLELAYPDKPLYIYSASGLGHQPPASGLLRGLYERGLARPFVGNIEFWAKPFLDELPQISQTILNRFLSFH